MQSVPRSIASRMASSSAAEGGPPPRLMLIKSQPSSRDKESMALIMSACVGPSSGRSFLKTRA
jgi:hypothetical protein